MNSLFDSPLSFPEYSSAPINVCADFNGFEEKLKNLVPISSSLYTYFIKYNESFLLPRDIMGALIEEFVIEFQIIEDEMDLVWRKLVNYKHFAVRKGVGYCSLYYKFKINKRFVFNDENIQLYEKYSHKYVYRAASNTFLSIEFKYKEIQPSFDLAKKIFAEKNSDALLKELKEMRPFDCETAPCA